MARPKTRPDPNVANPLAETSVQRRLWAAYLAAGYSRTTFARALPAAYQTVDRWDQEESMPELPLFIRACEIVGYTPNQLIGIDGPTEDDPVTDQDLSAEEREAFNSTVQAYAEIIKPTFIAVFRLERADGVEVEAARSKAHAAAIQAYAMSTKKRAVVDAVNAGGRPATDALGEELRRVRPKR